MTQKIDEDRRDITPHAEARLAIVIWGDEYHRQRRGCMEWWDQLTERRKRIVRSALDAIEHLPREASETPKQT